MENYKKNHLNKTQLIIGLSASAIAIIYLALWFLSGIKYLIDNNPLVILIIALSCVLIAFVAVGYQIVLSNKSYNKYKNLYKD